VYEATETGTYTGADIGAGAGVGAKVAGFATRKKKSNQFTEYGISQEKKEKKKDM